MLPVKRIGGTLTLAMADPTNVFALDDVAFMTNLQILPVVAPQAAIKKAIERAYDDSSAAPSMTDMMSEITGDTGNVEVVDDEQAGAQVDVFELKESADEAPVVKLVNMVLVDAIRKGASDLHWEPYEKVFRVRFRIDGVLHEMLSPPKRLEPAHHLPAEDHVEPGHLRAAAAAGRPDQAPLRSRVRSTSASPSCPRSSARRPSADPGQGVAAARPDQARLRSVELEKFNHAIHQPYGMVLITGPTGSGKTTTLYSAIPRSTRPSTTS